LSATEQDEVWRRWRRGESFGSIARGLGHRLPSVRSFIAETGGVRRRPPRRSPRSLSIAEREEISRGLASGHSYRRVAADLGRARRPCLASSPATVAPWAPHSPWQRGSNENTNWLLRQYLPKDCDVRQVTKTQLNAIAAELNGRPRQTLKWKTPAMTFMEAVTAPQSGGTPSE
jgi:hypothetical protein